jgi:hypothetical protein
MRHGLSKSFAVATLSILALMGCFAATPLTSQLAQLLKTNLPCRVRLQPSWTGNAKPTVRTGCFTNANLRQIDSELRFDWFRYSDNPNVWHFGPRTISQSAGGDSTMAIHTYRPDLPTDAVIQGCKTISALTNVLGPSQGFHDGAPFSAGWRFFTLTSTNTVETLSVFCFRDKPDSEIDSLRILRGIAEQSK